MPDPQTASEPELLFDPYNPHRNIVRLCASLTVDGVPCKQAALRGQNYCVAHIDRQPRAFEEPGHIVIPLLEDHSAIRLTCTKVAHSVANERMKPDAANQVLHACKIAASTLPRPARLQPSDRPQPRREAALSVVDECGTWIAPCEPFLSPSGEMTKYDELDARWTRKQQPANKAELDPAAALTNRYKQLIVELNRQRIAREKEESAAALAAGLPDPHAEFRFRYSDDCPFGTAWCNGPWHDHHCDFCRGKRQLSPTDPRHPGDETAALAIALSKHVRKNQQQPKQEPEQAAVSEPESMTGAAELRAPTCDAAPEPALALDLQATADRSTPRCSTRSSTRASARCSATRHRLPATGSPHVVKFVNTAIHNIPNNKKLVPSQKHNISPALTAVTGKSRRLRRHDRQEPSPRLPTGLSGPSTA
jgi:hypothetical protein